MKKIIFSIILMVIIIPTIQAQEKGYKGMFNAGWILLSENTSFEVLTVHGYQFNPYLFVGAGAGVNYYCTSDGDDAGYIPIFVDVRGYLLKGKISPYAEAKIGGQINYNENGTTGIYFAPEIGCKFALSSKFAFNIACEYILHREQNIAGIYSGRACYIDTGGLCLKVGVEF